HTRCYRDWSSDVCSSDLAAFAGLLWLCCRVWKRDVLLWLVVLSWVLVYSAITGSFYVKFMRYMLPVYPFLALMAAALLLALLQRGKAVTQPSQRRIATILPMLAIALV